MKNTSIIILTSILFFSVPAFAATHTWVDDAIGYWDDDGNWDIGEPVSDSTAYINNGRATVRYSGEVVYRGFYVGDGLGDLFNSDTLLSIEVRLAHCHTAGDITDTLPLYKA